MNSTINIEEARLIATALKPCPFCGGRGLLTRAFGQQRFGMLCAGCLIRSPEKSHNAEEAIDAWWKRKGSAAAGGRATRGISTCKKRRSSRKNLRIARRRKKSKLIWAKVDILAARLKAARAVEVADCEEALKEDLAWFREREAIILAHPTLRGIYDFLQGRIASSTGE